MKLVERSDVNVNDVRRYGDLIDRTDWTYDRRNHSLQIWKCGNSVLHVNMVDGETISIKERTE